MIRNIEIVFILLLSFPVAATDYYVSSSGGSGAGTKDDPWSLNHANAQLKAGDTAILRGGTYTKDIIAPARSGSSDSNRITYIAYSGEVPKFRPSSKMSSPFALKSRSYITIDGIDVDGGGVYKDSKYDNWIHYDNTSHTILKNSRLVHSKGYSAFRFQNNSSYNQIIDNYIDYNGTWNVKPWNNVYDDSGSMMWIYPGNDHNLIQGNTIKRSGHDLGIIQGSYNVIRYNYYDNFWETYQGSSFSFKNASIAKGDKVGNRTISLKEGKKNVVEYNIFANVGESVDDSGVGIMKVGGTEQIVRRNIFFNGTGKGEGIASSVGSSSTIIQDNRIYNNTFYKIGGPAFWINSYASKWPAPKGHVFKNNIVYQARLKETSSSMGVDVSFDKSLSKYHGNAFLGSEISHNCIANDAGAATAHAATKGPDKLTAYEADHPEVFFDNIQQPPYFESDQPVKREDFILSSSSPCKDTAGDLTTTAASGSGKVVKVKDASYFTDGNGLMDGDMIYVGSEQVMVKSVDTGANQLTVDRSINWADNDPVNLAVLDKKPDIGAVELESGLSPPAKPVITSIKAIR